MPSPIAEYGYISAKLKTRLSRFLSDEGIERILRAKSLEEAFLVLRGSYLEKLEARYAATGDLKSVEAYLAELEGRACAEAAVSLSGTSAAFLSAYAEKYSIDRIKDSIRLWFDAHVRGRPIDDRAIYLGGGRLDLGAAAHAPSTADAAKALSSTPYGSLVAKALPEAVAKGSLFELESSLDKIYFESLFSAYEALRPRDRASVARLVGLDVDIQNIANLVRLRTVNDLGAEKAQGYLVDFSAATPSADLARSFSDKDLSGLASTLLGKGGAAGPSTRSGPSTQSGPSGSTAAPGAAPGLDAFWSAGDPRQRLGALERMLRRMRISEARKRLAGNPFSIGVVMAYFILLAEELRRVRMILNAKYFGLSEDRLRSAL